MRNISAFLWGTVISTIAGLIGLDGAEFRLPVLVTNFKYRTLQAIVMSLVFSLVTVVTAFLIRIGLINPAQIISNIYVIINVLAGSV